MLVQFCVCAGVYVIADRRRWLGWKVWKGVGFMHLGGNAVCPLSTNSVQSQSKSALAQQ